VQSTLYCWYEGKIDKYWLIGPLKLEKLHAHPDLVQVYDFLGMTEMKALRTIANAIMTRSKVASEIDLEEAKSSKSIPRNVRSNGRTSSSGFIRNKTYPILKRFEKKVELFTGLRVTHNIEMTESPQAVSYTSLGSHYATHIDRVRKDK